MTQHFFLPGVPLREGLIHPAHEAYLEEWREGAIGRADEGDIAASICHQGALIELVLYGKLRHDWIGVMDEFLTDQGLPLAYSEAYGRRLFRFGGQYRQSTVHAIHTRWWIESLTAGSIVDHVRFADLVLAKKQDDGLIYDRDVSETILRHRMKTELTMSMAMGAEILQAADRLGGSMPLELATDITNTTKCPALGYMSMEYCRLAALRVLGHEQLFPIGIGEHVEACADGLPFGWGDFSIKSKVDAYMGTAKRTRRDKPIHSPLIACQVRALLDKVEDATMRTNGQQRLMEYACYLKNNPLDIPAFQMRDVPIPFGADRTPIEAICASFLITQCQSN